MICWRRFIPHPALFFVLIAWGLNFSVVKLAYRDFSPAACGLLRNLGSYPILLLACWWSRSPTSVEKADRLKAWWAGFVGNGIYMILFLEGMNATSASHGAIALATAPLWVSIFSVWVKQELFRINLIFGSILAFGGVVIFNIGRGSSHGETAWGTIIVLLSAITWAYSVILMRPLIQKYSALTAFTASYPGVALALIPYGLMPTITTHWQQVSPTGWWMILYLAVIAGAGAFLAFYKGIADVGPARATLVQFLVPPVAAFFAYLIFRDALTAWEGVGLIVLLVGVAWANVKPTSNMKVKSAEAS